jgi:hypothetical protein
MSYPKSSVEFEMSIFSDMTLLYCFSLPGVKNFFLDIFVGKRPGHVADHSPPHLILAVNQGK